MAVAHVSNVHSFDCTTRIPGELVACYTPPSESAGRGASLYNFGSYVQSLERQIHVADDIHTDVAPPR